MSYGYFLDTWINKVVGGLFAKVAGSGDDVYPVFLLLFK